MRKALLALAGVFLLAHLIWIPRTFADIDAVNFGLGVRDYDVAAHQPHPPGYPVFIAAGRLATAGMDALGVEAPEVRGLSLVSVLAASLAIPALFLLFNALLADPRLAGWATVMTAANPLYWFTAIRPLSDLPGLALALAAQAAFVTLLLRREVPSSSNWLLLCGAVLSGLAIGTRSQTFTLTLPLLAVAVLWPNAALDWRARLGSVAAFVLTCLAWGIPMLVLNGGVDAYIAALGTQAGEDFVGSAMLWTNPTPRAAAAAFQYSFLWPWGDVVVGSVVLLAAAIGAVRLLVRSRAAAVIVVLAFVPYAVFHLLFQETVMTRYALPLVPVMAVLAVHGLAGAGLPTLRAGAVLVVAVCLVRALPATRSFAVSSSPGARAIADAGADPGASLVAMHAVMRRHEEWSRRTRPVNALRARHGTEVLALVDLWRRDAGASVDFIADPRRTDLAMLDSRSRELLARYGWDFPEEPLMAGARPNRLERFLLRPPGWMLDQGWAVTAEVAGQSFRAGARPGLRPSTAWIRARTVGATLILGGRHLGPPGSAPIRMDARLANGWHHSWDLTPGFFVHRVELPAGTLSAADPYVAMEVTATGSQGEPRLSLEQFDLQSAAVPMFTLQEGWQEPEYNPRSGVSWRWMGPKSALWIRPIGRDVELRIRAESPLVYFDRAPQVRLSIGGQPVGELTPDADFTWQVTLPAALLSAAGGQVLVESSASFVPGGGDQRQLALRVYEVRVD